MWSGSAFLRDEKGVVTIEFTVLVPFFVGLFVFFADASVVYLTYSEMFNAARDAARRMATGQLASPAEVRNYTAEHLHLGAREYVVDARFTKSVMTVTIAVGIDQAALFGAFFTPILGKSLVATATMKSEPRLVPVS